MSATAHPTGLHCAGCTEPTRNVPPRQWDDAWGQRPDVSHLDGSPPCPVMTADGYRPAAAVPFDEATVTDPDPAPWPTRPASAARDAAHATKHLAELLAAGLVGDGIGHVGLVAVYLAEIATAVALIADRLEAPVAAVSGRAGYVAVQLSTVAEHTAQRALDLVLTLRGNGGTARPVGGAPR